ncbi:MAG: hypothetical protein KBT29_11820 [Prevotellaceae bacterium]|nr:hypothetical protein [Candidatus Minthosoma caballi]
MGNNLLNENGSFKQYKYDTMHGLNQYDYGARQYAPAIVQFTNIGSSVRENC